MRLVLSEVGNALSTGQINALDAVTDAVSMMEDEPLFNAGRGSVLAADGGVTMDASIMRGEDGAAGSVVNVRRVRHPIRAARAVLEGGWPVMLNSDAADEFAISHGLEEVDQGWLQTDLRRAQWQKWRASRARPGSTDEDDTAQLDHDYSDEIPVPANIESSRIANAELTDRVRIEFSDQDNDSGRGTVGAVALDSEGNLAAATSTGGMTGKPAGRIGDTPIIGAGTWCDSRLAVSCTGVGEAFIRTVAAHRLAALVEMSGKNFEDCTTQVLDEVRPLGGRGGLIAVLPNGEWLLPFQTTLMYRGVWQAGGVKLGIGPEWI
jgi:beta-aspartyl-peptidase (threonine type)